jgi:acetyltransferase-like isoleucine patch superfamily enzyme
MIMYIIKRIPYILPFIFNRIKKILQLTPDVSKDRQIFLSGKSVTIGRFTYGYENTEILSWNENIKISFGQFCSIACGLKLYCGGNHRTDWISTYPFGHMYGAETNISPVFGTPRTNGDICIGNDVWIGRDVTILSGIKIGDGAVIAANSHIVSDVNPYSIVGGNPAKQIKLRFSNEIVERLLFIKWWDYPIDKIERIIPFLCNQDSEIVSNNLEKIEIILEINS